MSEQPSIADPGGVERATPWRQQATASIMLKWVRDLEQVMPLAHTLVEQHYGHAALTTLDTIAAGLGQPDLGALPEAPPGLDLCGYLAFLAADLADQPLGQVQPGQIWFDPPSPEPGEKFDVCWEEQNVGSSATGPYKAMIRIGNEQLLADCRSLEPGESAIRKGTVLGTPAGTSSVAVGTPWLGSDDPALRSPAGRTLWANVDLAIGQEASAFQERQQQELTISDALNWAQGYIGTFAVDSMPDLHPLIYALQSIARVAQQLDSDRDLLGTATALLARDPATISAEHFAQARARAGDASVALTTAIARISMDQASPVDHEMTNRAALAILAAATTIQDAEPARSEVGEYEDASETTDEQGEELGEDAGDETMAEEEEEPAQ